MKIIAFLLTVINLHAAAGGHSQTITLSASNAPLEKIFAEIKKQTSYEFVYRWELLQNSQPVDLDVKNASIKQVLDICFKNQQLSYHIVDNLIILNERATKERIDPPFLAPIDITGRITDASGKPLVGANIKVKGTNYGTKTNEEGEFILKEVDGSSVLEISFVGYETQAIAVDNRIRINTSLSVAVQNLSEVIINKGYYSTTQKLNTGNVSKITAETIVNQPVSNPLAALQGRVPGVLITQSSGLPTSSFIVQIRGKNSLSRGTGPLFIIDGVPFINDFAVLIRTGGQSPFNNINPNDIESIEVLKDADATAIYGSKGANGVILITTKRGKSGKTKVNFSYSNSWGKVGRTVDLLNTQQYLDMRKEAFANESSVPTVSNAPDLKLWDTTRFTDWKEIFIGGTAKISNTEASISGGNELTQFFFSTGYNRQTTVFPESKATQRGTTYLNVNHLSSNNKFRTLLSASYSVFKPQLPALDMSNFVYLPPNAPSMYDSAGRITWTNWPSALDNPIAQTLRKYESENNNLLGNGTFEYRILPGLAIKSNLGYNFFQITEYQAVPIAAFRPGPTATGSASWSTGITKSWIIEPQANYKIQVGKGKMEILAGLSWQQRKQYGNKVDASGFTDDDLLGNLGSAPQSQVINSNNYTQYRYTAIYGNGNFNWSDKYILNANFRRDGSSRFGPAKRFSNFGALGFAWIFSNESMIAKNLSFLSFGKLRASFGITGNDLIGDYQFLNSWSPTSFSPYQGSPSMVPNRLLNENFRWERSKKLEFGVDLGFLQDRILFSAIYYRNRSDNQLVSYPLPSQTGFTSILANMDALLQNKGYEIELTSRNIQSKKSQWTTSFNLSVPKSKLEHYPGFERSPYKYTYKVGEPLDILFGYQSLGIDPQTGVYRFQDLNGNGSVQILEDWKNIGRIGQKYYGGFQNTISINNFQFDIFFQFVKQTGRNYLYSFVTVPGRLGNQPVYVLDRWQKPGDNTEIQKFTSSGINAAAIAFGDLKSSSAIISDASYIRMKNVSISYNVPGKLLSRWKIENLRIYVQGQNLLTITNYKGLDPETQFMIVLPPLRVLATGIQLTL